MHTKRPKLTKFQQPITPKPIKISECKKQIVLNYNCANNPHKKPQNLTVWEIRWTCFNCPRRLEISTICSLRVCHEPASKHSCRISVTAFRVPATSPTCLICFSTFSNASIFDSKLPPPSSCIIETMNLHSYTTRSTIGPRKYTDRN